MIKKSALGKGLEALIPSEEVGDKGATNVSINRIKSNAEQPRKTFDNETMVELAQSVKNHGIIQPLILKREGNDYIIVAGERRWRAAKMAGLKEVPAVIMDLTERDILEISLIENIQREDLNPIEEALAYKKLLDECHITQDELSKRLGKSRVSITNIIRLINLDNRVQQYLVDGVLTEGHGRALLAIKDGDVQYNLAQRVIDENISVRELERIIKNMGVSKKKHKKENIADTNPYYKNVVNMMQNHFGTKVTLNNKKDKGIIEIEYYSEEDLQRIMDIMNL